MFKELYAETSFKDTLTNLHSFELSPFKLLNLKTLKELEYKGTVVNVIKGKRGLEVYGMPYSDDSALNLSVLKEIIKHKIIVRHIRKHDIVTLGTDFLDVLVDEKNVIKWVDVEKVSYSKEVISYRNLQGFLKIGELLDMVSDKDFDMKKLPKLSRQGMETLLLIKKGLTGCVTDFNLFRVVDGVLVSEIECGESLIDADFTYENTVCFNTVKKYKKARRTLW